MEDSGLITLELPEVTKVASGKVREIFEVDDCLLLVATDRISAFDVVMSRAIPQKGKVLTQTAAFWFDRIADEGIVPHHLISTDVEQFPAVLRPYHEVLEGRSMLVRKCEPLPIECVVRGYLAGSGWKEYRQRCSVCGIELPDNLRESDELDPPLFTPATKAVSGHDENISFEKTVNIVGAEIAKQVRELSLKIYQWGRSYAIRRGIIICDTKFEFGFCDGELLLIDEVLTPDSSRFWPANRYRPGRPQPSFDKQYLRDYLDGLDWDKTAPGPELPDHVIEKTRDRYLAAYRHLTGRELS